MLNTIIFLELLFITYFGQLYKRVSTIAMEEWQGSISGINNPQLLPMIMFKYLPSICCNTFFVCISVCLFVYIYFLTYSLPPVYFDSANGSDNFCLTMYNASPIKSSIITLFQKNVFIHVAADIRTCNLLALK